MIVVWGGSGFLGAAISKELEKRGESYVAISRQRLWSNVLAFQPCQSEQDVFERLRQGNIPYFLVCAVGRSYHSCLDRNSMVEFFESNFFALEPFLKSDLCLHCEKLYFLSSCSVDRVESLARSKAVNTYDFLKKSSEVLVANSSHQNGSDLVIVRVGNVFGAEPKDLLSKGVKNTIVPSMVRLGLLTRKIEIMVDQDVLKPFIPRKKFAEGLVNLIFARGDESQVSLVPERFFSIVEMAKLVQGRLKRRLGSDVQLIAPDQIEKTTESYSFSGYSFRVSCDRRDMIDAIDGLITVFEP